MSLDPTTAAAFFDEMGKIAATQEYLAERAGEQEKNSEGGAEHDDQYVTKQKLKRLALMLPFAAAGTGLGYGVGKMGRKWLKDPSPTGAAAAVQRFVGNHPTAGKALMYAIPGAAGASMAGMGYLAAKRNKKVRAWIEGKHEDQRPK